MKPSSIRLALLLLLPCLTIQANQRDTTEVYRLIETAREKDRQGQADAAERDFHRAGALAEGLDFDRGLLMYAGHYCVFLYNQVRFGEALIVAEKQLEVSTRLGDRQRMGYAHNNLSLQYQAQGKLQQAADHLMTALDISSQIAHPSPQDLSDRRKYYNNLSSLLLDMNDVEKGRQYALQAFEVAEELRDTLAMGRSLVNVVVAEAMAKRLDEAERYGKQLLAISQSQGDVQMALRAYNNLGDIYRMQQRFGLALETFGKAQRLLDEVPPGNEVYVLMGFSSAYKDQGNYPAANRYYHQALALAEHELAKPQLTELYLSGAEIKERMGAYQEALRLRIQYEQLNDSLRNQENNRAIQELEMQYQTAEKKKHWQNATWKSVSNAARWNG